MATLTQAKRKISITTPLGPDKLLLQSLRVSEQLGRLSVIEATMVSEDDAIAFGDIVGKNVTIKMETEEGEFRYWNGFVSQFTQQGIANYLPLYRATVVPWLWFLTRISDCRIFQNMAAPDIIKQVLSDHGFSDISDKLDGTYTTHEYCVQYRETDFNFISRLMEEEGIYYFFKHEDGRHELVLADSPSAHEPYPGYEKIIYRPKVGAPGKEHEYIFSWAVDQHVQPGAYATKDFNFKTPSMSLLSPTHSPRHGAEAKLEIYDFPGDFETSGEGNQCARTRMEELDAQFETARAESNSRGIACGSRFTLEEFPRDDQNREYLIISAACEMSAAEFSSAGGNGSGSGGVYACQFTAMDYKTPFRPARVTPRPIVQGPQTAIVVGPKGEEIYTDKYGRVKVQFHWDRLGKKDENSSCWVRVGQVWAGANWGGIHLPRIGQEVIIDFIEGDPDRPIITGRVYNAEQMPPYALPANATQSGIKSRSSKGGGAANFNEIRMEDKKGSEQLYIHAEKNEDIVVENDKTENVGHDETISIGHDRTETVGHDETITVQHDRTETVVNNETLTVNVNRTRNVGSNESVTVGSNRTHTVGVNEAITVGAAQEITVGAAQTITVGAAQTITVGAAQATTVGADQTNSIGGNQSDDIGSDRATSVGENDTLDVGKKLVIQAGEEISITTGSASIVMKKDGTITIKGKDITIEGSGDMVVKASKNITMKGQKILQN